MYSRHPLSAEQAPADAVIQAHAPKPEPVPMKRLIQTAISRLDVEFHEDDAAELNEHFGVEIGVSDWKHKLIAAWEAVRDDTYLEGRG